MKINLVENGIFPITKDKDGNLIEGILDTGLSSPGTIQGEGKLIGTSCLFIRTTGCNLRCAWVGADGNGSPCDTPYSSHNPEKNFMEIDDVISVVKQNIGYMEHIVISGGEPTIQKGPLAELLMRLRSLGLHTTLETNATIFDIDIAQHTNLVSMSPKLGSSAPTKDALHNTGIGYQHHDVMRHHKRRRNIQVIQDYISYGHDFQLKFVVTKDSDIEEIERDFLNQLVGWKPSDIILMPEGTTTEMLRWRSQWALEAAIERGWGFTPRLHIELFGKARAV